MLNKIDINLLVSFATIIVLIMTLVCKDNFKSLELFYLVVIITLIIFMSSIKERFDEKFFSNYEIIVQYEEARLYK